jgi:IclR family transcriptional regulator, acetate operon repressor
MKAYTRNTIQSIRSLAAECKSIREKGFATDESEYLEGVRCLAAPIRDREGAVIASIGISAPAARFPREREREFAGLVVNVAAQIGELVGALEG